MANHINTLRVLRAGSGLALVASLAGCSGSGAATVAPGSQGGSVSAGGGASAAGGSATVGGDSPAGGAAAGGQVNTGGSVAQGGVAVTGGAANTGGAVIATTGGSKPTGGTSATGGNGNTGGSKATGGAASTGGTKATGGNFTMGGNFTTGGSKATGGAAPSGGNGNTGGSQATGGAAPTGGGPGTGGSTSTSDAATTISTWATKCLSYGYGPLSAQSKTDIINAIIGACEQFGPPPESNPGWKMEYCWAHLLGSILKESSYNVASISEPGNDPTVGLTQIRFSSTVKDFYTGGPLARLEAMGCQFPADFAANSSNSSFWSSTGGDAAHTTWMQTPSCNIGLGAWYYYTYATGGGDTATTQYLYQLCSGKAKDANLATGLMSHLRGPSNQWASIANMSSVPSAGTDYFNAISTVMNCALGGTTGTDAIFTKLTFNKAQYCK